MSIAQYANRDCFFSFLGRASAVKFSAGSWEIKYPRRATLIKRVTSAWDRCRNRGPAPLGEECRLRGLSFCRTCPVICTPLRPTCTCLDASDGEKTAGRPVESYGAGYALSTWNINYYHRYVRARPVVW